MMFTELLLSLPIAIPTTLKYFWGTLVNSFRLVFELPHCMDLVVFSGFSHNVSRTTSKLLNRLSHQLGVLSRCFGELSSFALRATP